MLIGVPEQLSQLSNPSLSLPSTNRIFPCTSACNLGIIFYFFLSFVKQIFKLSSTSQYHIRDLRRIRDTVHFNTASTIATSLVQSRLDYCNSLYDFLPSFQLHRLQSIQNALARNCISLLSPRSHHSNSAVTSLAQDRTMYAI